MKVRAAELLPGDEFHQIGQTLVVLDVKHIHPQHVRVFFRIYPSVGAPYNSTSVFHESTPFTIDYRRP
jgi:hypothetical protein